VKKRKQILSLAVVTAVLALLVYLQFRSWRSFDWAKFRQYTGYVSLSHIFAAVGLIYLAYLLRAIRWAIFLKPTAPTKVSRLIAPQLIGFAALGLFGRAGEFARPYLIARKEKLSFASQLAVWTVERFFDLGAVAVLMCTFLALNRDELAREVLKALRSGTHAALHSAGHKLPLVVVALIIFALLAFVLKRISANAAGHLHARVLAFKQGFNTIHDAKSFAQLIAISIGMWLMIAGSYVQVLHAYPQIPVVTQSLSGAPTEKVALLNTIGLDHALLIMGCSMFGSVLQLPGGVGGSQLAVITVLQTSWFAKYNIPPELAVSCGMLLWLVGFMAVIPAGVLLAHFEKISFLRLSEDSTDEEHEIEAETTRAQ
jgi:hypothetical protein